MMELPVCATYFRNIVYSLLSSLLSCLYLLQKKIFINKTEGWIFFLLLDVERYSDKYQNTEPSDNTIEWSPGTCLFFFSECSLPDMIGLDVQLELRLHYY